MTNPDNITILLDHTGKISYAMHENDMPIIKHLTIANYSDQDLLNGQVEIKYIPAASEAFQMDIPVIPAGRAVDLGEIPSRIDTEFILSMTEPMKGEIRIVFQAGELTKTAVYPMNIQTFDEWPGINDTPEITAAFATPGHPVMASLLSRSGELLGQLTGDPSLDGYSKQSGGRVREQLSAMFSAVKELGIQLTVTPGNYGETGQKIRLADEIYDTRLASSLDLSMLFVSLMEAAGLNPIVIFMEDRTFPGVWLGEESFSETVIYDITGLTKRTAPGVNRISLLESAYACTGQSFDFNAALVEGERRLSESDRFLCAVDIKRARQLNIKPLPIRITENGKYTIQPAKAPVEAAIVMPSAMPATDSSGPAAEKLNKQKVWERKLLDLSLRNNLINFKRNRNSIALAAHNIALLEDYITGGKPLRIMGYSEEITEKAQTASGTNPSRDHGAPEMGYGMIYSQLKPMAEFEFASGRLRAVLDRDTLADKARKLGRAAKVSIDENGSNTLYLALGLLKWYDRKDKRTEHLAPLVLLPVDITERVTAEGFFIKTRDEEAMFNVTLLELLKQEFGITIPGLDPLPMDETGPDLLKVFSILRKAVMLEHNWDVLEEAHLGLFAFSKFIMWTDLKDNMGEFRKNQIVASLLEGKLTFPPASLDQAGKYVDDDYDPKDILYPVSSDASQSLAVMASKAGKSFVLHGPPGTGKSQTITNIIANALKDGKRVLFVAQKMAALEVVERKLDVMGIGSFCLELHSNKGRKKAVLDQLERSLKITKIRKSEDYEKKSAEVKMRKAELNSVVDRLYEADGSGYSIYELIAENSKLKTEAKYVPLPANFDFSDIKAKAALFTKLVNLGSYAGGPYKHPLSGIGWGSYKPSAKDEIRRAAEIPWELLDRALAELINGYGRLNPENYDGLKDLLGIFRNLSALKAAEPEGVSLDHLARDLTDLKTVQAKLNGIEALKAEMAGQYGEASLGLDPIKLETDLANAESRFVLAKLLTKNPVVKELSALLGKGSLSMETILHLIGKLKMIKQSEADLLSFAQSFLAGYGNTFPKNQLPGKSQLETLVQIIEELAGEESPVSVHLAGGAARAAGFQSNLDHFNRIYGEYGAAIDEFFTVANFTKADLDLGEATLFGAVAHVLPDILGSLDGLKDYMTFKNAEKDADDAGLEVFTQNYRQGLMDEQEAPGVFKNSVVKAMLEKRLDDEIQLVQLTGETMEEKVRELKKLLAEYETLQKKILYYDLASQVPNLVLETATSKEFGIIQRALRSGAKNLSIRSLFEQTDRILRRITPCMLMSPMSVAQYLNPSNDLFDLVIFDEASQLPTPEAIGSLGRGKEAIIVGDPKQLPPTSFFMTANFDEDNPLEEDLDNILEDALALSIPEASLLWHYRSRHESLIAFSNKNFYDNKLYTYPSPDDLSSKVTLRKNTGFYDRGGKKVNETEGREIVAEIKQRIMDPDHPGSSIGVVTFSSVQQTLIEDLLDKEAADDPAFADKLDALPEPLFVKNLENVQGDERDVILFSVGYGNDREGKLSLNFGPLNQDGGWRRLNVAVTRSRSEMIVFTNITPSQLNVSKLSSRGVAELKAFLEYAGRGERTLSLKDIRRDLDSANLNAVIAEKLRERGYKVITTIGASKFKVDLAVVHPEDDNQYILGIMCGGESYRDSRACYDREILQKSVLNGLGWEIHNVFPLDWFENEDRETDRIVQKIEAIHLRNHNGVPLGADLAEPSREGEGAAGPKMNPSMVRRYINHEVTAKPMTVDEFLKVSNAGFIRQDLLKIIEAEAPISLSLLAKRIKAVYGLSRVSEKIEKQVEMILNSAAVKKIKLADSYYYWTMKETPETLNWYRKTLPEDIDRKFTEIAPPEIKAAVKDLLREPLSERALIKTLTAEMGYPRLNAENEGYAKNILDVELLDGILERNPSGLLQLKNPLQ